MKLHLNRYAAVILLVGIGILPVGAQNGSGQPPKIREVVNAIDRLYRHDSSHTVMEMEIHTPHWNRTLKLEAWSEGMDKTFIRILQPQKERGMGTLRIDNEMWNYLPKTNKVMKIPPSMMMSSWMGSDFKNNDLVKEFTFAEDYSFEYVQPEDADGRLLYLRCTPKPGKPIVWGYVLVAVDRDTLIPKWEEYYDEHGQLMRIMYFKEVENFDGKQLPSIMELVPQTKEGHKTVLHYIEAEFDIRITEHIFTLRNLRTFRR
jgi:outer membrane lipoprotein-sorting protein